MGNVADPESEVQGPGGGWRVIHISGSPGHMQMGRVMGQGFRDSHGATSNTSVACP